MAKVVRYWSNEVKRQLNKVKRTTWASPSFRLKRVLCVRVILFLFFWYIISLIFIALCAYLFHILYSFAPFFIKPNSFLWFACKTRFNCAFSFPIFAFDNTACTYKRHTSFKSIFHLNVLQEVVFSWMKQPMTRIC